MNDLRQIATSTLARLSPEAARREFAWLMYEIEMDFLQDIIDRPDVYQQAVTDALPDLPPDHAAALELIWQDVEERLVLQWEQEEPPDPERHAEIMRRLEICRAGGDELSWYKALHAPRDEFDSPVWERVQQLLKATGQPVMAAYEQFFEETHEAYRTGRYDTYFEQRSAGRWPDIKRRAPAVIFGVKRD